MPHLVSGMNFPKNFASLSMMRPCHCYLICLPPVHHQHHFHYASLHICSTPDSKLAFSLSPSYRSLPHLFRRISQIFTTISRLNCSLVFLVFTALHEIQTRSSHQNSVCPSVCPSVKRVNCDKKEEKSVQIFIPYERTFSLIFLEKEWLVGGHLPKILGQPTPVGAKLQILNR